MSSGGANAHYCRRRDVARAEVAALSRKSSTISLARVTAVVVMVAAAIGAGWRHLGAPAWVAAAGALAAFVVLVVLHDRVLTRKHRAGRVVAWAEEGIARVEDRWSRAPHPGDPQGETDHPYASDLDVFGKGSLLQSLDTTRTTEGRALLASWLSRGAEPAEVRARQRSARDLASRTDFLEALAVEGALLAEDPPHPEGLMKWAEAAPRWNPGPTMQAAALALPVLTLLLLAFGGVLPIPRASWVAPLGAQLLLAARYRARVTEAVEASSQNHDALARYAAMIAVVERARFEDTHLEELRAGLIGVSREIRKLGNIVGFVDARRNEVFRLLIGPLLMWDFNCALALERWRRRAGRSVRAEIAALARVEALCALAARAFEQPTDTWPEVVDEPGVVLLDARGVGHPSIPVARVVRNDVALAGAGSTLLVTGSNMSGKSTLLRALGSNVVLALAGAPVRAHALRTSPFDVHTSMRVSDSLEEGISLFLAELRRLKGVVDAADAASSSGRPILFLLDEILHGTNSRERHLGARAVVRHLARKQTCGAVSTHDLALSSLADELPGRLTNVHFLEQVAVAPDGSETMTFDYRLRPGVVTSSNALRLMRIVGIDIEIPPEGQG